MSHNTWIHRLVRPLVRPLARTALHPNHITWIRLAGGVAAAWLMATGSPQGLSWGAGLFFVSFFLDRADGELARLSGKKSAFGHKLDLISDSLCNALAFLGLGLGLRGGPFDPWTLPLGLIAGLSVAAVFLLVTALEARGGERAGEVAGASGFDPDDGVLAVPFLIWFGQAELLLGLAAVGAPLFFVFLFYRRRRDLDGLSLAHVWSRFLCARARWVAGLALASALLASLYAATTIELQTSTKDMLDRKLPFRVNDTAFEAAFPALGDRLIVVVEADAEEWAETAATTLARRLQSDQARISQVFYAKGDGFFRRQRLLYADLDELESLADRLAGAAGFLASLRKDPSLRGLAALLDDAAANPEELDREQLAQTLDLMAQSAESLAEGRPKPLTWRRVMLGQSSTQRDKNPGRRAREIVLVEPISDHASLSPGAAGRAAVTEAWAAADLPEAWGAEMALTGFAPMRDEELESLREGMGWIGLSALLLVACLLRLGLGSWRLAGALVFTLIVGLSWTAAFTAATLGHLNLISVAFAVLFIGLSVDFGIHFLLRVREESVSAKDIAEAFGAATARLGGLLLLCAISTALGFYAFLPTSYRGLSELGFIAGSAMFIALFANLVLLPALASLLGVGQAKVLRAPGSLARLVEALGRPGRAMPKTVALAALLLVAGSCFALPALRFDDDPLNLRNQEAPAVAAFRALSGDAQVTPYAAEVLSSDLAAASSLAAELAALDAVGEAQTLADFVPDTQEDKLFLIEDMAFFLAAVTGPGPQVDKDPLDGAARRRAVEALIARLETPGSGEGDGFFGAPGRRLAAVLAGLAGRGDAATLQRLEGLLLSGLAPRIDELRDALEAGPISLETLPEALTARWLSADGRARVRIRPARDARDPQERRAFVAAVQAVAPNVTGSAVITVEAGRAVVRAFAEALLYALAAIFLLLLVRLRSLSATLLVLFPLALAGMMTAAFTVLLGWPFNFANVIVLPLLFGLGVDSGIHLVARAREQRRAPPAAPDRVSDQVPDGALDGTAGGETTSLAVLLSALTTILSFGVLSFSSHPGTASMGKLLTLAVTLGMIATLVVLPALLKLTRIR